MSVSAKQWLLGLRSWKLFMLAVTLFFYGFSGSGSASVGR